MSNATIAVLGAGSWGTAIAKHLAEQDHLVRLWARDAALAARVQQERSNERYLPEVALPDTVTVSHDLPSVLSQVELVVWVIPSHGVRSVLAMALPMIPPTALHCAAIKGIENDSLMLVSEIFEEGFPQSAHPSLTYLGGPSFAREVATHTPTAVCVAGRAHEPTKRVQQLLHGRQLRVYTTEDVKGVELGGALKNVVAIASGISDGLGFGHNARAALITRGLHEISRLAVELGANPLTIAGLGGMGDLVLTCTGDLSRNRSVGKQLGEGRALSDVLQGMQMVAEGVRTTKSAKRLADKHGIEMPIVDAVYSVLYEDRSPKEAVADLMLRPPKHERH